MTKLTTFTVIMGSAYHDTSEAVYIAAAVDAQTVCAYVSRIALAQNDSLKTVLYCFKGVVEFCPTLFLMGHKALVPTPIDLRGPGTSKLEAIVDAGDFVYVSIPKHAEATMPLADLVADLRAHNIIVRHTDGEAKAQAYHGTDFTQAKLTDLIKMLSRNKADIDYPARAGKPGDDL